MNDDGDNDECNAATNTEKAVLDRLLQDLNDGKIRLHRSLTGHPFIESDFGTESGPKAIPPIRQCLNHRDVRAWLTVYARIMCDCYLKLWEANRIIDHLRGESLRWPTETCDDQEVLHLLETQPLLQCIEIFMEKMPQPRYETKARQLWLDLKKVADANKLNTIAGRRFPGSDSVMSRQLKPLLKVIEKLGFRISLDRSNGCKIVINRLDGTPVVPSSNPSDLTSTNLTPSSPADDRTALINRWAKRKQT